MRDEPPSRSERPADEPASAPEPQPGFREPRHHVPADLLNVSFPVAMRGYDRLESAGDERIRLVGGLRRAEMR